MPSDSPTFHCIVRLSPGEDKVTARYILKTEKTKSLRREGGGDWAERWRLRPLLRMNIVLYCCTKRPFWPHMAGMQFRNKAGVAGFVSTQTELLRKNEEEIRR